MITKIRFPLCSQAVCACIHETRGVEMPCVLRLEFAWVLGIDDDTILFPCCATNCTTMGNVQQSCATRTPGEGHNWVCTAEGNPTRKTKAKMPKGGGWANWDMSGQKLWPQLLLAY